MTARCLTLAFLVLWFGTACGNYGPPVRVSSKVKSSQPAPAAPASSAGEAEATQSVAPEQATESAGQSADSSEEDSDLKEEKP
jgi:hypothetical protein